MDLGRDGKGDDIMKVFVARQPIFNQNQTLFGYELLYRDSYTNAYNGQIDGSRATRAVISDTITTFGLNNLTNGNFAFINFTRPLIMERFAFLLDPDDFVIELLENMEIDNALIERLQELKEKGYILAIDDYTGVEDYDDIMEYIDIIKVDFSLVDEAGRTAIARRYAPTEKRLLAEKVETEEEFQKARKDGYALFQGYYFARPTIFEKNTVEITANTYLRILQEITKPTPNFDNLAEIIRLDISMTYKLLHRINTLEYYRSHRVKSIKHALVRMGLNEIRRWATLVLMREAVGRKSDEMVRTALVRGVFAEKITLLIGVDWRSENAFTTGMFSMIETVVDGKLTNVLDELYIPKEVKRALLGENNFYGMVLNFVKLYEVGEWDKAFACVEKYHLNPNQVGDLYLEAVCYADFAFSETPPPTDRLSILR